MHPPPSNQQQPVQQAIEQQFIGQQLRTSRARRPSRRSPLRRVTAGLGALAVLLWIVAIATHAEAVRRIDGPVRPVSFAFPIALSVLTLCFLILGLARSAQQQTTITRGASADIQRSEPPPSSDLAGQLSGRHAREREEVPVAARPPAESIDTGARRTSMICPSCGADQMSETGCAVCGATSSGPAHPRSGQSRSVAVAELEDRLSYERRPATAAFVAGTRTSVGVARAVQLRTEPRGQTTWQVLSFRLDRFDDEGRPLPSIRVEMRGVSLRGSVSDGETVEVPGASRAGQLLKAKRIQNVSTGSQVLATSSIWPKVRKGLVVVLVLLVFFGGAALIIHFVFLKAQAINQGSGTVVAPGALIAASSSEPAWSRHTFCVTGPTGVYELPLSDRHNTRTSTCDIDSSLGFSETSHV